MNNGTPKVIDAIMTMTSVRQYTDEPLTNQEIESLLKAGMAAPSACNLQPWMDAGTGPNDLGGLVISDKTKKKFSIIRMCVDACFLLCGWLLGGAAGVGTVISLFLVGPVAGFFLPRSEKLVNYLLKQQN